MISVVICSWNRQRLLRDTLESLCHAYPPERLAWQLIVVLNNCTDDSLDIVQHFKHRLPVLCISEPRPGLSYARNRAIELLSGDLVIWIDDDVRVSSGFLRGYEQASLQWPDASIFGGPILPAFEGRPAAWLIDNWKLCDSAFAARDVPGEDQPISIDYLPYGANFAVRTPVQRRFSFDVRLGRRPDNLWIGGEEVEVLRAILASGVTGRWVGAAIVHHVMPQERQTIAYIRSYYEAQGRLSGLRSRRLPTRFPAATCLHGLHKAITMEARFRALRAFARPPRWLTGLKRAALARGYWMGRCWSGEN